MNKKEMEKYLIDYLLKEQNINIDYEQVDSFYLLRALFNKREASNISDEFSSVLDKYLSLLLHEKGISTYKDYYIKDNIFLFQGDITTINTYCIVNAANKYLMGCFIPNHGCIDNAIHTFSGVQLRCDCNEIMAKQKHLEKNGNAKITEAYNLASKKVIHTVGPIVYNNVTKENINDLRNCYRSVLKLAVESNMQSIALCCISTGEFCFPNDLACLIAIEEVENFLKDNTIDVVFNVFKDIDYELYRKNIKV